MQQDSITYLYIHSENHALQNRNLERYEVLKIEDRVQCLTCFKYQRPGETFCTSGSILQGITAKVKKQAKQRTNSRFIMYVLGVHKLALKKFKWVDVMETLQKKTRKQEITWFRAKIRLRNNCGALPRGRAVPNAHARTGILAIRHGRI